MYSILLYLDNLPLINVQLILTKVYSPMYILRRREEVYLALFPNMCMFCSVVVLRCRFKFLLFVFFAYPDVILGIFFVTCHPT